MCINHSLVEMCRWVGFLWSVGRTLGGWEDVAVGVLFWWKSTLVGRCRGRKVWVGWCYRVHQRPTGSQSNGPVLQTGTMSAPGTGKPGSHPGYWPPSMAWLHAARVHAASGTQPWIYTEWYCALEGLTRSAWAGLIADTMAYLSAKIIMDYVLQELSYSHLKLIWRITPMLKEKNHFLLASS